MAEWIGVIITVLLFLGAVIAFFAREREWKAKKDEREKAIYREIENLKNTVELKIDDVKKDMNEVKEILGNGHGLRHDVHEMQKVCAGQTATIAGELKDIRTRQSAMQHEIDDIKAGK